MGMTYHHYYDTVADMRRALMLEQKAPELHDRLFQEEAAELDLAVISAATAKTRAERQAAKAEYADALADMLVIWCGKDIDIGIPADDTYRFFEDIQYKARAAGIYLAGAFRKVIDSNMSKLGRPEDDAATVEKFNALEIEFYREVSHAGIVYFSAVDQVGSDGKEYPAHKMLKPASYFGPRWDEQGWEA